MVVAIKGIVVQCDPPTMEILLQLNESRGFVIEVLSGEFVLCSENVCDFLEDEVTRRLELAERPLVDSQKENKKGAGEDEGVADAFGR